jgi:hypothetical protein
MTALILCLGLTFTLPEPVQPVEECSPADASYVLVVSQPKPDCQFLSWDSACQQHTPHFFRSASEAMTWLDQQGVERTTVSALHSLRRVWIEKDDGKWRVIQ